LLLAAFTRSAISSQNCKGAVAIIEAMNALTPSQRDRALYRMRRVTVGVAAGASISVLGIGYVAAASYAGKTTSSSNQTASTASLDDGASSGSNAAAPAASSGSSATTGSSGTATVTTGGSGHP